MTPQYILRKSLCRSAHCYSAHVPGQGFVNRGDNPATRADYDQQRARSAACEIDNLQWAADYAERGYTAGRKGVLFANWNVFPRNIDQILERYGYSVEWSDEWATCNDCNRAVRTSPDSYVWTPAYSEAHLEHGEILCRDCAADDTDDDTDDDGERDPRVAND